MEACGVFSSGNWETLSGKTKMETLVKKWGNMSLDDREGGEVKLNVTERSKNITIAAKFLTKRALNTEAVIRTFN